MSKHLFEKLEEGKRKIWTWILFAPLSTQLRAISYFSPPQFFIFFLKKSGISILQIFVKHLTIKIVSVNRVYTHPNTTNGRSNVKCNHRLCFTNDHNFAHVMFFTLGYWLLLRQKLGFVTKIYLLWQNSNFITKKKFLMMILEIYIHKYIRVYIHTYYIIYVYMYGISGQSSISSQELLWQKYLISNLKNFKQARSN